MIVSAILNDQLRIVRLISLHHGGNLLQSCLLSQAISLDHVQSSLSQSLASLSRITVEHNAAANFAHRQLLHQFLINSIAVILRISQSEGERH